MNIESEKLITNIETLKLLQSREKNQEAALSRMQMITLDFLKKSTSNLNGKMAGEIAEKLTQEVPALKEMHIIAILDCPPRDAGDVDVLFSKGRLTLDKKEVEKVIEIVKPLFKEAKKTKK